MKLEAVLILDTETTGLDPAQDRIVEIGAVLWSVRQSCILSTWSELVFGKGNSAEGVNRIPPEALAYGLKLPQALAALHALAQRADLVVAHNADFNRAFIGSNLGLAWVCSMADVEWPRTASGRSLPAIALAHDVPIVTAHRALADCLIIARLFERVVELGHDVRQLLERAQRPKATYQAMISYEDRELAKDAGFKWQKSTKRWVKSMAEEDVAKLEFAVTRVKY